MDNFKPPQYQWINDSKTKQTNAPLFGVSPMQDYSQLMQLGINTLSERIKKVNSPTSGVHPTQLQKEFAAIDLNTPLNDINQVLEELDQLYLKHAIYFHHPDYLAHLNCPVMLTSLLAELFSTSINTAVETWDQSAGATLIEQKVIDWTCQRIGYDVGADGVFTTGGTQSNLMALLLARELAGKLEPQSHTNITSGLSSNAHRYRILCSEYSHFSIQKAAALLGLGHDAVISVASDVNRCIDTHSLENTLSELQRADLLPIAVIATAGTTDFGAIDPIASIAHLCKKHNCYLHVDAAYGGALLVSQHHNERLSGIELADSVSIDFHKTFFQPVCCSALLVKDKRLLSFLTYHADYLNPKAQAQAGVPDLINKSLQTTRRFDALKLWLSLRTEGPDAIGAMFDTLLEKTQQVYQRLVKENQQLLTLAALLHQDSQQNSLLVELINTSQLTANEWVSKLMDLYLQPLLHAFFAYDLVFMPHGENLILVLEEHQPVTILMKDIGEEVAILNGNSPLPGHVANLAVCLEEDMKLNQYTTGYFRLYFPLYRTSA